MADSNGLTLGLGTVLFGERYSHFLPGWWESVTTLNRQPDSVVITHDSHNEEYIKQQTPSQYAGITKLIQIDGEYWEYRHAIQQNQTADWFSICGIDDRYLPEAFDELQQAHDQGCDIYIDKLKFKHNGEVMSGSWVPERIPYEMTCPGQAPMKSELYRKTAGITEGSIFDDWELYIRCVAAGAKPYHANTLRIIHDLGYDHVTLSGVNRDMSKDKLGKAQIARVREELGL